MHAVAPPGHFAGTSRVVGAVAVSAFGSGAGAGVTDAAGTDGADGDVEGAGTSAGAAMGRGPHAKTTLASTEAHLGKNLLALMPLESHSLGEVG